MMACRLRRGPARRMRVPKLDEEPSKQKMYRGNRGSIQGLLALMSGFGI